MKHRPFSVRKLTPSIGAELDGLDLSLPLSAGVFQEIHDALLDNLVIFFRDQKLTPDQHKALGRRFGKLHIHPAPLGVLEGHPEIVVIKTDQNSRRIAGEHWHSDVSCDAEPPMGSILYITEVPPLGGDTLFASVYAAFEALSDPMQRFLCGLTAIHDGARNYDGRQAVAGNTAEFPRAEHPVVRTHPETVARPCSSIACSPRGSRNSIRVRAISSCRCSSGTSKIRNSSFQWRPNSIAFWDNRCAQHQALWDYFPHHRYGNRVTISGDRPFYRA
jgi:taurine dioxygenase